MSTCLLTANRCEHECKQAQKNCKNHPEHQNDQNLGQDNPHECGQPTPPQTLPLPLSLSRDVGVQKTSKQEHRANPKNTLPLTHDMRT